MNAAEILGQVLLYCDAHKDDTRFEYHRNRIQRFAVDQDTRDEVAAGYAEEDEVMTPEDCLWTIQLYLENQGDKFHPHSDKLLELTGPSR